MISLEVKNIMVKKVVTYPKTASLESIAKEMSNKNISCVVITENQKPIGLITERDVMKKVVSKKKNTSSLKAKDIMTTKLRVIPETENIFNAAALMEKLKIRRLPVVRGKKLVGLITETDVIRAMTGVAKYLNEKLIEYITNS